MILYSTGCPLCKTLEMKMNQAGVSYILVTDVDQMEKLGFQSVPVLYAKGVYMDFSKAMKFIDALTHGWVEPEKENTVNEDQHQTGS